MIKRKPTNAEVKNVLSFRLAMVVTKDSERILIGTEENIKRRLSGQSDAELMYDEVRPFGNFLISATPIPYRNWETAISNLFEAQKILHSINPILLFSSENVLYYEGIAQDILTELFDTDDPICQFVALKIWYGYWLFRGERRGENCSLYLNAMHNLVRPFSYCVHYIEDGTRVADGNAIFRHPAELKSCDKEQTIYHIKNPRDVEFVMVDRSLIPLEKYYITQFSKWTKYLICCKNCGRIFFADSLKYELCSQECRDQTRKNILHKRKNNEEVAQVDRICLNASAHWYNRLKKIKASNECSEEDVHKYEMEKDRFLKDKIQKRKAYKKGKITFAELRDWLLHQEVEAQAALESLMATRR